MAGRSGYQVTPLARDLIQQRLDELRVRHGKETETLVEKGEPAEVKIGTQRWLALKVGMSPPSLHTMLDSEGHTSDFLLPILDLLEIPRWVGMPEDAHIERRRRIMETLDRVIASRGEDGTDAWIEFVIDSSEPRREK